MALPISTLAAQVERSLEGLRGFLTQLTGADDPAAKGAARVLMRAMRKRLSQRMANARVSRSSVVTKRGVRRVYGEPSAPGESPRMATGRLRRSIGSEVVGGVLRVGSAHFVSRLLEEGVDSAAQTTPSGRDFNPRRRKAKKARRVFKIARRPFMEAALQDARPRMEVEAVSELQARDRLARIG